jgi:hypothetical protein
MLTARFAAAFSILLAAALVPAAGAKACSVFGPPPTEEQVDAHYRTTVPLFDDLFEAEVLRLDDDNSEMIVTRVFRGALQPGMILRGHPSRSSCPSPELQVGLRGFVMTTFGPRGPRFAGEFLREESVASMRRIGVLPAN